MFMNMDIVRMFKYGPNVCSTTKKQIRKMLEDFEPAEIVFQKGSYVFGRCQGQLHWPAKVTKVDKDQDEYSVNMEEYQKHNKSNNKVFQAIRACKKEIEGLKKKQEKQQLANMKKATKKKIAEGTQPGETSDSTPIHNHEKKAGKALKKLANVKIQSSTPNQSKAESDLANQYTLEGAGKDNKETNNMVAEIKRQDQQIINKAAQMCEFEAKIEPNQQLSFDEMEKIDEDVNPVGVMNKPEPTLLFSTASNQEQSIQPIILSEPIIASPDAKIEAIVSAPASEIAVQDIQQANGLSSAMNAMQVVPEEYDIIEAEDKQKKAVEMICAYLGKMIDYLTGKAGSGPLSKDQKLDLAILLDSYRKFYYDHVMLETMVNFLIAFDFKLKDVRKHCIIERVKIRERVETACFLRGSLCYDEKTLQILDRYRSKANLFL